MNFLQSASPKYLAILGFAVFVAVYLLTFDAKLSIVGDNVSYLLLGQALADGLGFTNLNYPGGTPHVHYPPGYPVVVMLAGTLSGWNIVIIKVVNGIFLLGTLYLLFLLTRKFTNRTVAVVVSVIALMNVHLLVYSSSIMSEIPFTFFSMLAIYLLSGELTNRRMIMLILSLVLCYYLRAIGIALIGTVVVYFLLEREFRKTAIIFGSVLILILPWIIRNLQVGSGYIGQFWLKNPYRVDLGTADLTDLFLRFTHNSLRYISQEIPNSFFPVLNIDYTRGPGIGLWIVGLLIIACVVYGLLMLHEGRKLVLIYSVFFLGILLVWPDIWYGVRFITPLIPILLILLVIGVVHVVNRFIHPRLGIVAVILIMILQVIPITDLSSKAKSEYPNAWENYIDIAKISKANLENEGTLVSCGKPDLFYYFSDRQSTRFRLSRDQSEVLSDLERRGVTHILIDQAYPNTVRFLRPVVLNHPDRFRELFSLENPRTILYEFHTSDESAE